MSLLIESIKLFDGKFFNLEYHQERVTRSLSALFLYGTSVSLEKLISRGKVPQSGYFKCRVVYNATSAEVAFTPYQARNIRRVKVVEDDDISYPYKFADRSEINRLFADRADCDDVLIVCRGKVTDCSYSNVVFRKDGRWYTPDSPLLQGTMRAKLIRENKIQVREILKDDIRSFDSFKIINAMLEFDGPEIDVTDIVF